LGIDLIGSIVLAEPANVRFIIVKWQLK